MKTKIFYISEESLTEAIRRLYPENIKSKDYEYLLSIYVKRIYERYYKKTFKITFELNNKHQEVNRQLELTPDETVGILRTYLEENTPVDFGLAPVDKNGEFEGYSFPFQIKKYIGFSSESFLNELLGFIKDKSSHYCSPNTSLIVLPELSLSKGDELNAHIVGFSKDFFRVVAKKINIKDKSLRSILIFSLKDNEPVLTQVWPNYGEYQ